MGNYIRLKDRIDHERGDRLTIFLETQRTLLGLPKPMRLEVLDAFLHWCAGGDDIPLPDPSANFILEFLKKEQRRVVEHALNVGESNKKSVDSRRNNGGKRTVTNGNERKRTLANVNDGKRTVTNGNVSDNHNQNHNHNQNQTLLRSVATNARARAYTREEPPAAPASAGGSGVRASRSDAEVGRSVSDGSSVFTCDEMPSRFTPHPYTQNVKLLPKNDITDNIITRAMIDGWDPDVAMCYASDLVAKGWHDAAGNRVSTSALAEYLDAARVAYEKERQGA